MLIDGDYIYRLNTDLPLSLISIVKLFANKFTE